MRQRYETDHASVEWSSETLPCEREYTYPVRRKELEGALKEALDECLIMSMQIQKLEKENFALVAGACIFTDGTGLVGDEYGDPVCLKDGGKKF